MPLSCRCLSRKEKSWRFACSFACMARRRLGRSKPWMNRRGSSSNSRGMMSRRGATREGEGRCLRLLLRLRGEAQVGTVEAVDEQARLFLEQPVHDVAAGGHVGGGG